jgi:TetR/AcrR family transcriptional repressor of nem operon
MSRPTKLSPERGNARIRILEAARDMIREKGFAATSVDDLCRAADVTKGAFFHHFAGKDALGVAVADFWTETNRQFFGAAPYHNSPDALDRVLAYVAFRKAIIAGRIAEFTCLVGTLAQEVYATTPDIRDACARSVLAMPRRWKPTSSPHDRIEASTPAGPRQAWLVTRRPSSRARSC